MAGKRLMKSTSGRKPKPLKTHINNGNPSKKALNKSEPEFTQVNNVECPEWLGEYAQGMWETIVPEICRVTVLCVTDIHNIESFCSSYENFRRAQKDIMKNGVVIVNMQGNTVKNPAATVLTESQRQMVMIGSLLGLDPSSRTRVIGVAQKEKDSPYGGGIYD